MMAVHPTMWVRIVSHGGVVSRDRADFRGEAAFKGASGVVLQVGTVAAAGVEQESEDEEGAVGKVETVARAAGKSTV